MALPLFLQFKLSIFIIHNQVKDIEQRLKVFKRSPLPATNPRNILIFNLLWGYFYIRNITFSKTIRPGRAYELAVNVFAER